MAGFFLTFEGSEGCGKSTQIGRLVAACEKSGISPLVTREPGGTAVGEEIRNLLKHSHAGDAMVPESELLLFSASRAQLVREVIAPALENGRLVICDRFFDSTTVYQGVARRLAPADVAAMNRFAVGSCVPDLTIVLDMDAQVALQRARTGRAAVRDRMEEQEMEFYEAVRAGYLALAKAEPKRVRVVDSSGTPDETFEAILKILLENGHGIFKRLCA